MSDCAGILGACDAKVDREQNGFCGVITNMSRVHQPPGGGSSFSFGERQPLRDTNYVTRLQVDQLKHAGGGSSASQAYHQPYEQPAHGSSAFGGDAGRMRGSSNAYANGANQNCGNVITDRSSTRLHAPPGGHSSLNLSWGGGGGGGGGAGYGSGYGSQGGGGYGGQGGGGGYGGGHGGGHGYGGHGGGYGDGAQQHYGSSGSAPSSSRSNSGYRAGAAIVGGGGYGNDYRRSAEPTHGPGHGYGGGQGAPFGARVQQQSSNAYANGSNQNCGNVLTDRSSTRLHAPPGGHSSFRLG